jgi:hypothetical protein
MPVPLTTQTHDDTAEISGLAVTIDDSNSDSEKQPTMKATTKS